MADIYLHLNGEQKGPFPLEKVRAMLAAGEITLDTLAWHEGLTEWRHVAAVLAPPAPGAPSPMPPIPGKKGMSGWLIALIIVAGLIVLSLPCCCGIALGPINAGIKAAKQNISMQHARMIGLAMQSYATDHDNKYPDGATSTEVFQKLLDGKYITDPEVFFVEMTGKTKPVGSHLTADNVCYDVTSGVTASSSDQVPLVFSVGFTVDYDKGQADITGETAFFGLAVCNKDMNARFIKLSLKETSIAISLPLAPHTEIYRQLHP